MPYGTIAESNFDAELIELYHFRRGAAGMEYRYCSIVDDVVVASQATTRFNGTYTGNTGIKFAKPTKGRDLNRARVDCTVPKNHPIAQFFSVYPPSQVLHLYVYRTHASEVAINGGVKAFWQGEVLACDFALNPGKAVLQCEHLLAKMQRVGLRWRYQEPCNTVFGDAACGVDLEALKATGTLDDVDGITLTSSTFASEADGHWELGKIRFASGEVRFIKSHVGDEITIRYPIAGLLAGASFEVYPGCPHTRQACAVFGGMHKGFFTRPERNPFIRGLK